MDAALEVEWTNIIESAGTSRNSLIVDFDEDRELKINAVLYKRYMHFLIRLFSVIDGGFFDEDHDVVPSVRDAVVTDCAAEASKCLRRVSSSSGVGGSTWRDGRAPA